MQAEAIEMKECKTVLIVDDDEISTRIAQVLLERDGNYRLLPTCINGRQAIRYLSSVGETGQELPDVLLLDLDMPIMDGQNFLTEFEQLKHSFAKVPRVYVVTGSDNADHIQQVRLNKNIEDVFLKPLDRNHTAVISNAADPVTS